MVRLFGLILSLRKYSKSICRRYSKITTKIRKTSEQPSQLGEPSNAILNFSADCNESIGRHQIDERAETNCLTEIIDSDFVDLLDGNPKTAKYPMEFDLSLSHQTVNDDTNRLKKQFYMLGKMKQQLCEQVTETQNQIRNLMRVGIHPHVEKFVENVIEELK